MTLVKGGNDSEKFLLNRIRTFQKAVKENRRCADCLEVGATYICMDFGTFICTSCAGIHREFNHKVKGISVSIWSREEVEFVEANGNEKSNRIYLATRSADELDPEANNAEKARPFIRMKYIEKRWVKGDKSESKRSHKSKHAEDDTVKIETVKLEPSLRHAPEKAFDSSTRCVEELKPDKTRDKKKKG